MVVSFVPSKQPASLFRKLKTACNLQRYRLAIAAWILFRAGIAAASPLPLPASQSETMSAGSSEFPNLKGTNEWGWNSGGAASIPGGVGDSGFWTLNLRWGRVLTDVHGPVPLRGSLEYAVEVVPAFAIKQSTTVFGYGVTPLLLQYNFAASRRLVPFIQAGAGMLFTREKVPENTSDFNFTPQGGFGVYWLRGKRSSLELGMRYHHISNAGTARRNPGHNGLYFYTGISWWR
jgi:hypothetical protein